MLQLFEKNLKKMSIRIESSFKIPKDIMIDEDFSKLSRQNKRFYLENLIMTILRMNRKRETGVTLRDLNSIINFVSDRTINTYIVHLNDIGEIYSLRGKPMRYFINGRVSHEIPGGSFELSKNRLYEFKLIANNLSELLSPFIIIEEFKRDEFDKMEKKGSIMIKGEDFDDFINYLQTFKPTINEYLKNFKEKVNEVLD